MRQARIRYNQTDEPDGKNDAVYWKGRASLKDLWPAGYPQTFGLRKKMKAQEFVSKWTTAEDNLEPFDLKRIEELRITDQSKEFLKVGLPSDAAPFLSFGYSDNADLQPVSEVWGLPTEFECYKVIGSNGYGDPICVNENDNSIVYHEP